MIKYAVRLTHESPYYADTFTCNLLAVTRITFSQTYKYRISLI